LTERILDILIRSCFQDLDEKKADQFFVSKRASLENLELLHYKINKKIYCIPNK